MKNYTKQITAFAVLSLIAYSANAQSATFNWDQQNNGTGPTSGMTIAPAAPGVIPDVSIDAGIDPIDNVVATTAVVDPTTGAITTTIVNQVATYNNTFNDVVVTDIDGITATETVIINSEGIDLNSSTTTPNTVTFDIRVTEVSTNDGLGTPTSITSTFTATAVDAGVAIQTIAPVTGTDVADALANMEASLVGLAQDNTAVLGSVTTPGTAVSGGGNLNVSGNLAVGAIADVEEAFIFTAQAITDLRNGEVADNAQAVIDLQNGDVADNAQAVIDLQNGDVADNAQAVIDLQNGDVADNAQAVIDLQNGDVADNAQAVIDLQNGDVADNAQAVIDLQNGDVADNAQAVIDLQNGDVADNAQAVIDLQNGDVADNAQAITDEVSDREALIRRDGDNIRIGGNTLIYNDTTDTISTTSGDLTLDADVDITGDLTIAGLTGDVASRINSNSSAIANNSSRIASNKEDIEQNTRGIAMVAALQHTTVLPGMNNAFDLSAAHFEGETGLALNFARRINENVQINFGAASTTDFDESVIKAGIGVQW